ncbi:hypothetical protein FJZ36_00150 [Candidatus Poribacteria bacterium]|nr:hypothetical protein [Candidatus Poribacteria bacterium]
MTIESTVCALVGADSVTLSPVSDRARLGRRVWRVGTPSGEVYAVKHLSARQAQTRGGYDSLDTEWAMLSLLHGTGDCVPEPVGLDEEAGLLVTRWFSDGTFDDVCQRDPCRASRIATMGLRNLRSLQRGIDAHESEIDPYCFEMDYDAYLGSDFLYHVDDAHKALEHVLRLAGLWTSETSAAAEDAWLGVVDAAQSSEPTIGSLDYNARNVLVNADAVVFADWSTVGWDWNERRIAQYFIALGSSTPDGNFVQSVSAELVDALGDGLYFDPAALEAHVVVFLSVALERVLRGGDPSSRSSWAGRHRYERLMNLLGRGAVASHEPSARVRHLYRRASERLSA